MPTTNDEAHTCRNAGFYAAQLADEVDDWPEARRRIVRRYPATGRKFAEYLRSVFENHYGLRMSAEKTPESEANGPGEHAASNDANELGGS